MELPLPNPLKPGVKSPMADELHLSDQPCLPTIVRLILDVYEYMQNTMLANENEKAHKNLSESTYPAASSNLRSVKQTNQD